MASPGPVSDSYDPEFGTGVNAHDVRMAVQNVVARIAGELGTQLKDIVRVVQADSVRVEMAETTLNERELRVIRFGLNRALENL